MDSYALMLILVASISLSSGENFLNVSDAILKDVYNIYNKIPFTSNNDQNITVERNKIKFYLFSSNDTEHYTLINSSNASAVDNKAPIIFLIYGWLQNMKCEWYPLYTEMFFNLNPKCNVIQVDYSTYSKMNYISASFAATKIGYTIGEFIVTLIQEYSISIENVLLIGHSLGGQIGSFAGKKVRKVLNKKLPRLIAMDPAGPIFEQRPKKQRLNKKDFTVVEVVHSDAGVFGMERSCGTIDFFLNGGSSQPGCLRDTLKSLTGVTGNVLCAHSRSWMVLRSAIQNPGQIIGKLNCDDKKLCSNRYVDMGNLTTHQSGNYYVKTTSSSPFFK